MKIVMKVNDVTSKKAERPIGIPSLSRLVKALRLGMEIRFWRILA